MAYQTHTRPSTRILLIEDDVLLQIPNRNTLEWLVCEVTMASSVADALAQFQADHHQWVFVDLKLPDGSGLDIRRAIRQRYPDLSTPLIALSTEDPRIKPQCLAAGMQDFVFKLASKERLRQVLNRWILKEAKLKE